jgi:hypothetical protein
VFRFHGFSFEVLRRQRHQITLLKVIPPTRDADGQDSIADISRRDSD